VALLLRRSSLVLLVAVCVGMLANAVSPQGLPLLGPVPRPPDNNGFTSIDLDEAYRLFLGRRSVFVDARSGEEFREGRIPGARLLTYDDFEETVSTFRDLIPEDTILVTYCSGEGCGSSREVAELLSEEGYKNIRLFVGGWDQWKGSGYPVEKDRSGESGAFDPPGEF
jgi:rhodanese-related sulfurtransferase